MAQQSLKNLNSFSRGYIENFRSKRQADNTFRGVVKTAVDDSTLITFKNVIRRMAPQLRAGQTLTPELGYQLSCELDNVIVGVPKIIDIQIINGITHITLDIKQTIPANTVLVLSDHNSGLSKYELSGNTLNRSKENVRTNELIPSELLEYTKNSNSGGVKTFLDSYYSFMNLEQFIYRKVDTFEDIVINGIATFRIPNPKGIDNRFFSETAARSSKYYNENGTPLIVGDASINEADMDINVDNIQISNIDNLPSNTAFDSNTGRTLSIYRLPAKLNGKKIKIETQVQYYVGPNPSYRLNTIEDALNINENEEIFLDMMQKEIAPAINKDIKVNKRALYQRLIDFYKLKGSTDSINTFFKLFFQDEEINLSYPWDNTLKTSMGNYDTQSTRAPTYERQPGLFTASDGADNDLFGSSVSIESAQNLMAVGAPGDDSAKGAVYVYNTSNDGKTYIADATGNDPDGKIVSPNAAASDDFGSVVSLSDNLIAISNPDDQAWSGGTAANSGSVEIWERVLTTAGNPNVFTWVYKAVLVGVTAGSNFGTDISLYKGTLCITAPGHVNADRSNGAVYVYKSSESIDWTLSQVIPTPLSLNGEAEGWPLKVVVNDDYIVTGWSAYNQNAGSMSVFGRSRSTGLFVEETTEANTQQGQKLGASIDIDSDGTLLPTIVAGLTGTREVQIFQRSASETVGISWNLVTVLAGSQNETSDDFGSHVKIYNDNVFVGAPSSGGVNELNPIANTGLIYHFEYGNNTWFEAATYNDANSNITAQNKFGTAFDISRKTNSQYLLAGSPGPATGGTFHGHITSFTRELLVGKYLNNEGFLSDSQKIQDSNFYQKFSYVIKAGQNLSKWEDTYNKLVHPAGFKYFGEILLVLKGTRDLLGDSTKRTTVQESVLDEQTGLSSIKNITIATYGRSKDFRKTMSSMPGIQSIRGGYIGNEDLGLLVELYAAFFSPFGDVKANKNAKLSVSSTIDGSISGVRIIDPGAGYLVAPTITGVTIGSGYTIETTIDQFGSVNNVILKGTLSAVESTAASPTTFTFDSATADSDRDVAVYDNLVVTGGSGSGGKVKITVDSNKKVSKIQGVTGHLGTGYQVGDTLTVAAGSLESSGTDSDAFSFSIAKIINGTGYTNNSGITTQPLSAVTGSGAATAIGKVTSTTALTLGTNALTVGAYYKIKDKGNATDVMINSITDNDFDKSGATATSTYWKNGDVFRASHAGNASPVNLTTTAKIVEFATGIQFSSFANKKYKNRPIITIGEPQRLAIDGKPFSTNVQATAAMILDTEIAIDNTDRLSVGDRYTIVDMGDADAEDFNLLSTFIKGQWIVGDTFVAANLGGSVLAASTTAFVVPYNSAGKISEFRILNPGLGYVANPDLNVKVGSERFKVPDVIPIKIVTNGNEIQTISSFGSVRTSKVKTSINRTNDYFSRKDYSRKAILGTKKFHAEYTIEQFSSLSIENVNESDINKNNVNTQFLITEDRNT